MCLTLLSGFVKILIGIDEPLHIKRRKVIKPGFIHSPWKSAYIRQHRIDTNWRRGELKSPKVTIFELKSSYNELSKNNPSGFIVPPLPDSF